MTAIATVLGMGLGLYPTDAAKAEALLRGANAVTVAPTAQEVGQFFDLLGTYWVPSFKQVEALVKVIGTPVGALYHNGFVQGGAALDWVHFDRTLIGLQLIIRIANIKYIQQTNHPLCGPVAFIHDVARRDPKQYVEFVIGLATQRQGTIGNLTATVSATSALLGKHPNPMHIKEADYIALASLRDRDNLLPYRAALTNRTMEGASMPKDVAKWMTDAGYTHVSDHTHMFWRFGGLLGKADRVAFGMGVIRTSLTGMQTRLVAGDTVVMLAAANLAYEAIGGTWAGVRESLFVTMFGAHFILVRSVDVQLADVGFDIVTWGRESANPPPRIGWSKLTSWYQGYICGTP